jgi:putative ABC transport system permease protein
VKAVYRAARGGLTGRRLQAAVIALVVLACTAACTLALGMLVDTRSPFGHAFATQRGADVTVLVRPTVPAADLAATTRLSGVTASAGPFPQLTVTANENIPGTPGSSGLPVTLTGRASPGGPVDDLTLESGHWPTADNQVVWADQGRLSRVMTLGATVTVTGVTGSPVLTVVGIANSVTNTSLAWVLPGEITALERAGASADGSQLLYRFASAGTSTEVSADVARLTAALPAGALIPAHTTSYLSVEESETSHNAPWVPFILTFGIIALVMSVLIVVNVVSGAVVAGTTRIGVLKSIGFTPVQVVGSYVLQVVLPALVGCVVGTLFGNLLAVPLLKQNATVYQVGHLGIPPWVDGLVPLAILVLTGIAAVLPALRAGRMSAVQAIATGRAPRPRHGYLAHRMLGRARWLPRPVTIGFAAPFARPARTLVTAAAVLFGAIAVTFGVGLASSLDRVETNLSQAQSEPVQVSYFGPSNGPGPGSGPVPVSPGSGNTTFTGPPGLTAAQSRTIVSALSTQPGTLHYVPETDDSLPIPGQAHPVSLTAFTGDASWTGYALITGRWYSGPGQIDANTEFLTATGTSVGSLYTLPAIGAKGHPVTVRIVGEVFQPGNDLDVYLSSATLSGLDPGILPAQYDVGLSPGVNAQAYANALNAKLGQAYAVNVNSNNSQVFDAVLALVSLLTILLVAVAGLGVLNTVVLQLRERVHDLGVFKSVGMTPRQSIAMVICSVVAVGLVAGVVAVPLGVLVHNDIIPVMAHAANSGVPSSMVSVYTVTELVVLGLAGLVIAIAGALGPAAWAARSRTAAALRTE